MIKIKWIKVGDIIEVDGKKAKLKSIVEDSTYQDVYTFKREDGSKFFWRRKEVYEYVMERHIKKLESLLREQKQRADELEDMLNKEVEESYQMENRWRTEIERADELEKRWEKLKEHFIKEKEQSFGILSWSRNNGVLELIERLQEDDNA